MVFREHHKGYAIGSLYLGSSLGIATDFYFVEDPNRLYDMKYTFLNYSSNLRKESILEQWPGYLFYKFMSLSLSWYLNFRTK